MMPAFFFSVAVILNLGNWMSYYLKIGDQASLAYDDFKQPNKKLLRRFMQVLTLVLLVCLPGYCVLTIILSFTEQKYERDTLLLTFGYFFVSIGLLFAISSLFINLRIKKYFPYFYKENRCILLLVLVLLSIPLILRGFIDIVRVYSVDFNEWVHEY
jgi:hydrogenase-4 membrane subunit HyfE